MCQVAALGQACGAFMWRTEVVGRCVVNAIPLGHTPGPGAGAELLAIDHLVTGTPLFVANSGSRVSPDSDQVCWFQSPACPPLLGLQSSTE